MPFTLSHPAAVLPLRRPLGHRGDLLALVIGSMTPDFTYYVPVAIKRTTTHSVPALFWFCLPVGLITYVLFDRLLKAPCAFLLPTALRRRLGDLPPQRLGAARLGAVALGVFVGALTHILWDSFTHAHGAATTAFPSLRSPIAYVLGIPIGGYRILQDLSTVGGAAVVALFLWRWYRTTPPRPQLPPAPFAESARATVLAALLTAPLLVALSGGLATAVGAAASPLPAQYALTAAITTFRRVVVAALASLLAYGVAWRWRTARRGAG